MDHLKDPLSTQAEGNMHTVMFEQLVSDMTKSEPEAWMKLPNLLSQIQQANALLHNRRATSGAYTRV